MTEAAFQNKGTPSGGGSLAKRILWLCLSLLALPMLLIAVLFYQKEERIKLRELLVLMDTLGSSQAELLQEMIQIRLQSLGITELFFEKSAASNLPVTTQEMEQLCALFLVENLFVLRQAEGGEWVYAFTNDGKHLGEHPSFDVDTQLTAQKGNEALLVQESSLPISQQDVNPATESRLLILKRFAATSGLPEQVVGLSVTASQIVHRLLVLERAAYPYDISMWDLNGHLFGAAFPVSPTRKYFIYSPAELTTRGLEEFHEGGREVVFTRGGEREDPHVGVKIPVLGVPLVIVLDISERFVSENTLRQLFLSALEVLLAFLLLGGTIAYLLTRRMAKPLASLSSVMQAIREERYDVRYSYDRMGFELNAIGASFNQTIDTILLHMQEVQREKLESERLRVELGLGRAIQQGLLPPPGLTIPGCRVAHTLEPAKEVSGDYYDLFPRGDQLLLVMADTAGKGISACLYALSFRSILRSYFAKGSPLEEVVARVHELFALDTGASGMFVTVWMGVLSRDNKLRYISCGHPPAYLRRRSGAVEELGNNPLPVLGAFRLPEIRAEELQLQPGDLLLLYTDGITEAQDGKGLFFGNERLKNCVSLLSSSDPQVAINTILAELRQFCSGAEQADDETLMTIEISNLDAT